MRRVVTWLKKLNKFLVDVYKKIKIDQNLVWKLVKLILFKANYAIINKNGLLFILHPMDMKAVF